MSPSITRCAGILAAADLKAVIAHDRGLLVGIVAACFLYAGAETTLNVWLPKFQIDVFASSDSWASLSVTLFWVGLIAGRISVMRLTRRYAPSRLMLICACTMAVFTVAVALAPSQAASLTANVYTTNRYRDCPDMLQINNKRTRIRR